MIIVVLSFFRPWSPKRKKAYPGYQLTITFNVPNHFNVVSDIIILKHICLLGYVTWFLVMHRYVRKDCCSTHGICVLHSACLGKLSVPLEEYGWGSDLAPHSR